MRKLLSIGLLLVSSALFTFGADPIPSSKDGKEPIQIVKSDWVTPKQTIQGVEKPVAIGDLVKLSLSKLEIQAPLTSIDEVWNVYDVVNNDGKLSLVPKQTETFTNSDGSKVVIFGSGTNSRTLFVQVSVTYLFVVKEGDKVNKIATKTVVLTAPLEIGDGTNPNPPTPDVIPDGKFGLTKLIYNSVNSNVKQGKVIASKKVAAGWDAVVAKIRGKTLTDPEEILTEASLSSKTALEGLNYDKDGWKKSSDEVQNRLFSLYSDKSLKTSSDYGDALSSLADGLRLIK